MDAMGRLERFTLEGRPCAALVPAGEGPWPVAVLCGGELGDRLAGFGPAAPGLLLFSAAGDWERDYTPWPAPSLEGRAPFTGEAGDHLRFLTGTALPALAGRYPVRREPEANALLGYSLGGLFAFWASCAAGAFGLFGSLSGSLWYDGWPDYLRTHPPGAGTRFYLSLGRAEEHGGPPRMRTVGDRTRWTLEYLTRRLGPEAVTMEWNRGGHFTGVPTRWTRALAWAAARMDAGENR